MISLLYNLFTRSFVVLLVAMLSVNYLPDKLFHDYPFEPRALSPNQQHSIMLEWNSMLTQKSSQLEYIQLNQIRGPESVAVSKSGLVYTGLSDGRLVELDPSRQYKLRQVLKFNPSSKCIDNHKNIDGCGRFLQLRFHNQTLFALETNTGLYKVDIDRNTKTLIGPQKLQPTNLYNAFAFDPKEPNIVYITVSSTRWPLKYIMWSLLELEDSGQIIALDVDTGKRVVVIDKLMTPNGIDSDPKRDQLIFTETTGRLVSSLPLQDVRAAFKKANNGDKLSGITKKTLIQVVPGSPDNVIIDSDNAFIALPFIKDGKDILDHVADKPSIRKAFGRAIFALGKAIEYVCVNVYKHPLLESAYKDLKSGQILYKAVQNDKSGIIRYNLETKAQKFLGSDHFSYLSEASPDGHGNLFLGSFESPFLVKVKEP